MEVVLVRYNLSINFKVKTSLRLYESFQNNGHFWKNVRMSKNQNKPRHASVLLLRACSFEAYKLYESLRGYPQESRSCIPSGTFYIVKMMIRENLIMTAGRVHMVRHVLDFEILKFSPEASSFEIKAGRGAKHSPKERSSLLKSLFVDRRRRIFGERKGDFLCVLFNDWITTSLMLYYSFSSSPPRQRRARNLLSP